MANTVPPKYTRQIGPAVTPEVAGLLSAIGKHAGVSAGQIAREAIDAGLTKVLRAYERERGSVPVEMIEAEVERHRLAAEAQAATRRAYDDAVHAAGGQTHKARRRNVAAAAEVPASA